MKNRAKTKAKSRSKAYSGSTRFFSTPMLWQTFAPKKRGGKSSSIRRGK